MTKLCKKIVSIIWILSILGISIIDYIYAENLETDYIENLVNNEIQKEINELETIKEPIIEIQENQEILEKTTEPTIQKNIIEEFWKEIEEQKDIIEKEINTQETTEPKNIQPEIPENNQKEVSEEPSLMIQPTILLQTPTPMMTATPMPNGTCGIDWDNITWTYDTNTKILYLEWDWDMANYSSQWAPWYTYRFQITWVVLSWEITSIWDYSFDSFKKLQSINIPDTVTEIWVKAFYDCNNLSWVILPDWLKLIKWSAFSKCKSLKSINLPDWIDFTWSYIFDSSWLTGIVIPWSIKDIWNWAFNNCTALAEVTIMEWVETIPYRAFRLTPITHIELPNSIKSIEQEAFSACSKLSSIYIWPNIENIVYVDESHAYTAFHECTNLKSIYIDHPEWFLEWWPWWADNADIYRFWNFDYSPATNTSWNVLAYLTGYSDNIQISNNSWLFNYIFTNNWDFTFRLNEKYDKTANVYRIDRTNPTCNRELNNSSIELLCTDNIWIFTWIITTWDIIYDTWLIILSDPIVQTIPNWYKYQFSYTKLENVSWSTNIKLPENVIYDLAWNSCSQTTSPEISINTVQTQKDSKSWWGITLKKDKCPDWDFSDSYYDWSCEIQKDKNLWSHNSAWEKSSIGQSDLFERAKQNNLVNYSKEESLDELNITRGELAKISSLYSVRILWKSIDKSKISDCTNFWDMPINNLKDNVYNIWACALWIMWYQSNLKDYLNTFRANDIATKSEIEIVLSRIFTNN